MMNASFLKEDDKLSEELQTIINLKVELAHCKSKLQHYEQTLQKNSQLEHELQSMGKVANAFEAYNRKILQLAKILSIQQIQSDVQKRNTRDIKSKTGTTQITSSYQSSSNYDQLFYFCLQRVIALKKDYEQLQSKVQNSSNRDQLGKIQGMLIERKSRMEDMQKSISQYKQLTNLQKQKNERLTQQLMECRRKLNESQQQIQLLQEQLTTYKNELQRLNQSDPALKAASIQKRLQSIVKSLQVGEGEYLKTYLMKTEGLLPAMPAQEAKKTKYDLIFGST